MSGATGLRRVLPLLLLLASGGALIALLGRSRPDTPLPASLARPFQLLGTPVQLVDRLASRALPVGSVEERELGDVYRRRYAAQVDPHDRDQAYLDRLMAIVSRHGHRPFAYRAFRIGRLGAANAMALPGGVILVSDELLNGLHSESELVAVLAHEMGHVERGHCFDAVRFRLLGRRSGGETLGALADAAAQLLVRHSYGKTAEHEADDYAFTLLRASVYDPSALAGSFAALQRDAALRSDQGSAQRPGQGAPTEAGLDPLRDYLRSHPPLQLRRAEFAEEAEAWWRRHPGERRYVGVDNLRRRLTLAQLDLAREWRSGAHAR